MVGSKCRADWPSMRSATVYGGDLRTSVRAGNLADLIAGSSELLVDLIAGDRFETCLGGEGSALPSAPTYLRAIPPVAAP